MFILIVKQNFSEFSKPNKIHEIVKNTSENSVMPDDLVESLTDYTEKHGDFMKASSNFLQILRSCHTLTNTQLRKLETQFNNIVYNYMESKTQVENQMNILIEV